MRFRKPLALLAVGALALAGCSSSKSDSSGGSSSGSGSGLTSLRVGVIPISNMAPLVAAQKLGYFKDEGLDVQTTSATAGSALTTALSSGNGVDIIYSNYISLMLAKAGGFDVQIIADQNRAHKSAPDSAQLQVAKSSSIHSLSDLRGKKIAINGLNNINEMAELAELDKAGIGPKDVTFVQVPFPSMGDALAKGSVAAASVTEPFSSGLIKSGATRTISYPYVAIEPGLDIAGWASTGSFVSKHKETVEGFVKALGKADAYLTAHTDERSKYIADYTKTPLATVQKINVDDWPGLAVSVDSLKFQYQTSKKFGIIKGDVDIDSLIGPTAR